MSERKNIRLNKLAKEFNVSVHHIIKSLNEKGEEGINPTSKISQSLYEELLKEFQPDLKIKMAADLVAREKNLAKAEEIIQEQEEKEKEKTDGIKLKGEELNKNLDIDSNKEIIKKGSEKNNEGDESNDTQDKQVIKGKAKLIGLKSTGEKIQLEESFSETLFG